MFITIQKPLRYIRAQRNDLKKRQAVVLHIRLSSYKIYLVESKSDCRTPLLHSKHPNLKVRTIYNICQDGAKMSILFLFSNFIFPVLLIVNLTKQHTIFAKQVTMLLQDHESHIKDLALLLFQSGRIIKAGELTKGKK